MANHADEGAGPDGRGRNARIQHQGGRVQLIALRPISAGSEVRLSGSRSVLANSAGAQQGQAHCTCTALCCTALHMRSMQWPYSFRITGAWHTVPVSPFDLLTCRWQSHMRPPSCTVPTSHSCGMLASTWHSGSHTIRATLTMHTLRRSHRRQHAHNNLDWNLVARLSTRLGSVGSGMGTGHGGGRRCWRHTTCRAQKQTGCGRWGTPSTRPSTTGPSVSGAPALVTTILTNGQASQPRDGHIVDQSCH